MATLKEIQDQISMAGISRLSKQIYKDVTITTEEVGGGRWVARIDDGDEAFEIPEKFGSNADAFRAAKREIDDMEKARG